MKLILTYLKNNETVEVILKDGIILGREHCGKELFSDILYISREHCKLKYEKNNWKIEDINSQNGTFIIKKNNPNKEIDCRKKEEYLEDGDILLLGKEKFLVTIMDENGIPQPPPDDEFYCKKCGSKLSSKPVICEECNTYND